MKVERVRQRRRGLKGVRAAMAARTAARQPSNASAAWVTRERRDFVYDDWNQVLQRANERTVFSHRENGFKVTRGGLTDDEPYGLSRRPYYFDY